MISDILYWIGIAVELAIFGGLATVAVVIVLFALVALVRALRERKVK